MRDYLTKLFMTAQACVTLLFVTAISSQCSIRTAEIDGKQAAACLQAGGNWAQPPKASSYSCVMP